MPKGKGKRHTPEQIVAILRRAESGETVTAVCRETNISVASFHRWKSQYGGMDLSEAHAKSSGLDMRQIHDPARRLAGSVISRVVAPAQIVIE